MTTGQEMGALLAMLESALADLEIYAGWEPATPVVRLLTRRRHSARVLRRQVGRTTGRGAGNLAAAPARAAPDLADLIGIEDRLADWLDDILGRIDRDDWFRPLIESLRTETDDMARALRLMQSQRRDKP